MNNLRDTGSLVLGAASHWHVFKNIKVEDTTADNKDDAKKLTPLPTELRVARADYELHSNKLLMLFSRGSDRHKNFKDAINNLSGSLSSNSNTKLTHSYKNNYEALQELIHDRIYEEWEFIKGNLFSRIWRRIRFCFK
jgi:hypothetical protein